MTTVFVLTHYLQLNIAEVGRPLIEDRLTFEIVCENLFVANGEVDNGAKC